MASAGEAFIGPEESHAETPDVVLPPTAAELRSMFGAFCDAKDRWKIDGATMKGFYLHSESGYLYCWDQPTGILYEFEQSTGLCPAVWSAALPGLNAEIWTVLPLPPTDPASLQAGIVQSGNLPNIDVFLVVAVAHEAGKQLPPDVVGEAVDAFCDNYQLFPQARRRLRTLPPAGQCYVLQNFRGDGSGDSSRALNAHLDNILMQNPLPWGNSACSLRIDVTGAIIGRCCPDFDRLCRDDPPSRLAQAHCKIMSEEDRFFLCDLGTSEEGTLLDGFTISDQWVGPLRTGSLIACGPLRIRILLSDMAKDTLPPGSSLRRKLEAGESDDEDPNHWRRKVFQRTSEDKDKDAQRRLEQYKDRAEERRQRCGGEAGSAIDGLINKFEHIKEAERLAEKAEDERVEMPTVEAQREAGMNRDGSFVGYGSGDGRAGIGFHSQPGGAELIPDVADPRGLSAQDASRLKTQMRFQQSR